MRSTSETRKMLTYLRSVRPNRRKGVGTPPPFATCAAYSFMRSRRFQFGNSWLADVSVWPTRSACGWLVSRSNTATADNPCQWYLASENKQRLLHRGRSMNNPRENTLSPGRRLRDAWTASPIAVPGVFNALVGRMAERIGFQAVYLSGAALSASTALPDVGLLTLTEFVEAARIIAAATRLPLLCDADTGFGE